MIYDRLFNTFYTFLIWIGNPNPLLWRFRLAAGVFFFFFIHAPFEKDMCLTILVIFCQYLVNIWSIFVNICQVLSQSMESAKLAKALLPIASSPNGP